jgi:hypothetical protein
VVYCCFGAYDFVPDWALQELPSPILVATSFCERYLKPMPYVVGAA